MSITRACIILVVFLGILFFFRDPLSRLPEGFKQLHSPYAESFRNMFNEIISATSSSVLGNLHGYIPTVSGTSGSSTLFGASTTLGSSNGSTDTPSRPATTQATKGAGYTASSVSDATDSNQAQLLPVISNQEEGKLSPVGIISYTNTERRKIGLSNLLINNSLTASAEDKLQDMFSNQYFEHVSPTGENVSTVASRDGYAYVVVGENLALGIFSGDDQVVAAWMASSGHKKNILDPRYKDIGVAIGQGMYQGRMQWLIVQHFGKPLSACVSPNAVLKRSINTQSVALATLDQQATAARSAVDQTTAESEEYASKVDAYNKLVMEYNAQKNELQKDLVVYNASVSKFNTCIGSNN